MTLKAHAADHQHDLQHCHAAFDNRLRRRQDGRFLPRRQGRVPDEAAPAKTLPYQYVHRSRRSRRTGTSPNSGCLADEMFQTQGSGSFTAHQDLIRGGTCIQGCQRRRRIRPSLVDNPTYWPWGCDANPSTVMTTTINIYGMVSRKAAGPFPCSNKFPNYGSGGYDDAARRCSTRRACRGSTTRRASARKLIRAVVRAPIATAARINCDGDLLDAFDVIYPVRNGSEWGTNVSWPETNIFSDITSRHAAGGLVGDSRRRCQRSSRRAVRLDDGPSWVASVVNADRRELVLELERHHRHLGRLGRLLRQRRAAVLQDQCGGLGFRVPMMVISPYAIAGSGSQGGYISHTQYEFGSILKYIEGNWNLGSLGTTDVRATSIGNVFNYSQSPRGSPQFRRVTRRAVLHRATPYRATW